MSGLGWLPSVWDQQSVWSQTADRLKQRIGRARAAALGVTVAVAVLGALSVVLADPAPALSRVAAGIAAGAALLLPVLRRGWSGEVLRDWTRARSVSEALKSEVYLWLAGVGPYRDDPDGARLRGKIDRVRADGGDLLRFQSGLIPRRRDLPDVHDVASYFDVRVTGQIDDYYRKKAVVLQTRLRRFRVIEIGLAFAGAVLGGVAAGVGGSMVAPWIAVTTTIAAAVAVHVAATRYEYQLIEFLRTADRLDQLRSAASAGGDADELDALAVAAEEVISIENKGWMAKLAEDPPDHAAAGADK